MVEGDDRLERVADVVGDGLGRASLLHGPLHQLQVLGPVEVVGRTYVGCSVGVEHDHVTRVKVSCLGLEPGLVEHSEQRSGLPDLDGGAGVAVNVDWQGVTSAGEGQRGALTGDVDGRVDRREERPGC